HHVLDAAALMRTDGNVLFAFVGEGAEKERLQRLARQRQLNNVHFIGQQSKQRVPHFYAACDMGIVSLRKTELFQDVLPSKLFEYLGMARPVLLSVGGEARRLIEESGGGVYVEPKPRTISTGDPSLQGEPRGST